MNRIGIQLATLTCHSWYRQYLLYSQECHQYIKVRIRKVRLKEGSKEGRKGGTFKETWGGGFDRCKSLMLWIHFSIAMGFFAALSIDRTTTSPYCSFLLIALSCSSSTVGSDCDDEGSSRYFSPRSSSFLSGLGT